MYVFATVLSNAAAKTTRNDVRKALCNLTCHDCVCALQNAEEINETRKLLASGREYWATARVSGNNGAKILTKVPRYNAKVVLCTGIALFL